MGATVTVTTPKVTIGEFKIRRAVVSLEDDERGTRLRCTLVVDDVVWGQRESLTYSEHYSKSEVAYLMENGRLGMRVRDLVMTAMTHEVDEHLRINGEYIVDPHPELRRASKA